MASPMRCAATSRRATASSTVARSSVSSAARHSASSVARKSRSSGWQHRPELCHRLVGRVEETFGLVARFDDQAPDRVAHPACRLDSATRRSMSLSVRPVVGWTMTFWTRPVPWSRAETVSTPSASMSNDDLDLRHAARRRRDAGQLEVRERLVVVGHLALALEHVDVDERLVVDRRREDLGRARRQRGVARDQAREHAAHRLDAERQRRDVEQQHLLDLAGEHAGLDRARRPRRPRRG